MGFLLLVVALVGLLLAACTAYQTLFLIPGLVSLRRRPGRTGASGAPRTRFVVLVPAHNEAALIGESVASLLRSSYPPELREVLVIADNCGDDTAARARLVGATRHERPGLRLRGKPHALDWMISRLDLLRFDAVVIVDGDTKVDPQFLRAMDAHLASGEKAIQG